MIMALAANNFGGGAMTMGGGGGWGATPMGGGGGFSRGPSIPSLTPSATSKKRVAVPITIHGIAGSASLLAAKAVQARMPAAPSRASRVEFEISTSVDAAAFAEWLAENEEWRAELGAAALAHSATSGAAFIAVGPTYVADCAALEVELVAIVGKLAKAGKVKGKGKGSSSSSSSKTKGKKNKKAKTRPKRDWGDAEAKAKAAADADRCCAQHRGLLTFVVMLIALLLFAYGSIQFALMTQAGKLDRFGIFPGSQKHYRAKLEAFYAEHNPELLKKKPLKVSDLLSKWRGKEYKLFQVLEKKYAKIAAEAAATEAEGRHAAAGGEGGDGSGSSSESSSGSEL